MRVLVIMLLLMLGGMASAAAQDYPPTYRDALLEAALEEAGAASVVATPEDLKGPRRTMILADWMADRPADALAAGAFWMTQAERSRQLADEQSDWSVRSGLLDEEMDLQTRAVTAFYAAYRTAATPAAQADALHSLSQMEEARTHFVAAELAAGAAVALAPAPGIRAHLDRLRTRHGFRIVDVQPDAERDQPRLCLALSEEPSAAHRDRIRDFLSLPAGDLTVEALGASLCVGGLRHGDVYRIGVLAGLRSASGRPVVPGVGEARIPDRAPAVAFSSGRYVLPPSGGGVPMTAVNVEEAELRALFITDRQVVEEVRRGGFRHRDSFADWTLEEMVEEKAVEVWAGRVAVEGRRQNRETLVALPVDEMLGDRQAGLYLILARPADLDDSWSAQWLIVSDIGLATFSGPQGLTVFAQGLGDARPLGGLMLALMGRDNHVLGEAVTDADGRADFAAGLVRGTGARTPALLTARTEDGDYAFLDLSGPAFDLSDRGVAGRPMPGPVDPFLYTDRGVYRPGSTAHVVVLARESSARALPGLPLTLTVVRPDERVAHTQQVTPDAAGAAALAYAVPRAAPSGQWRVEARIGADGEVLGEASFIVDDIVPPRIEAELTLDAQTAEMAVRYLYGAPGADLAVDLRASVLPDRERFESLPGFLFGREEEDWTPVRETRSGRTDADGVARVPLAMPPLPETGLPLKLSVSASAAEAGGRPVRRVASVPLPGPDVLVGLRARGGESVGPGAPAVFEVAAVDADGRFLADGRPLTWRLYREREEIFWHMTGDYWRHTAILVPETAAEGTVTAAAGPVPVDVAVDWGRYRMEVEDPATGAAASIRFHAGWGGDADAGVPDAMEVRLDGGTHAPGSQATLHLRAPFAGEALVTVLREGVEDAFRVPLPAEGTAVPLTVGAWGAGAYVTVTAFRPATESGPGPGRAVGLAWLAVDPGTARLPVAIDAPAETRSDRTVPVTLSVPGMRGPVRVTLAAVDEGILQLTDFRTPDPLDHYHRQRRLAVDLRDYYGRLLDGRDGAPGRLRSGGDAGQLGGNTRPPREEVAVFSGLLDLGPDGTVTVPLAVPQYAGRLRLMAVAVSADGVGSAEAEMVVRDPVLADLYLPRFLAPGDGADVLAEVVNAAGPAGAYRVEATAEGPLRLDPATAETVTLAEGATWRGRLALEATGAGDGRLTLAVTAPSGARTERSWPLTVRPATTPRTQRLVQRLAPGERLVVSDAVLHDTLPDGRSLTVAPTGPLAVDIGGLARDLADYPYGCVEQTISRTLPLLHLSALPEVTPPAPADRTERLAGAVQRVLSAQTYVGGFSLWDGGETDPWVSVYATDFLLRARDAGLSVDQTALEDALRYLARLTEGNDLTEAEPDTAAYALSVLAARRLVEPGAVRRFRDATAASLTTALGQVHLAAALAAWGQQDEAAAVLPASLADPGAAPSYRLYGSAVRDGAAAVVALAATLPDRARALVPAVADAVARSTALSTQDQAWLVAAAAALGQDTAAAVTLDDGSLLPPGGLPVPTGAGAAGLAVVNTGPREAHVAITARGAPLPDLPAEEAGIRITRGLFDLDGQPLPPDRLVQGQEAVVVLDASLVQRADGDRRLLLVDLLPAGLEIQETLTSEGRDNPFSWLVKTTGTDAVMRRDDRHVAAVTVTAGTPVRIAYRVRAVTPGRYVWPAAMAEDMYAPAITGRGEPGRLDVSAP